MTASVSRFFWYELMTTDVRAAADFYAEVVGWNIQGPDQLGMDYTVLRAGERGVVGVTEIPASLVATGALPFWIGYIRSDDVDADVAGVIAAGGASHGMAEDVPGVGRFAMVNDPQGTVFMLMNPIGPDRPAEDPMTPGLVGWRELMAIEGDTALEFYRGQFGWTRSAEHDMGSMGSYLLFNAGEDGDHGGMMTKPPQMPSPHWNFYFSVESVTAAARRLKAAGGIVINGPMQVPGGNWILQARDPQEAMFCLTSRVE